MNWIIASLLMFVSSIITYLFTRKATLLNLPTEVINFATFFIPLFLYIPMSIFNRSTFIISPLHFLFIFIMAFFCSYITNFTSLKSIKYAPNPGYSLILSKSYVFFTTIVAVIFFKSELNIKSALAILIIIGFSALVMIGKTKTHRHSNSLWIPYALVSFFGWGMLSIGTKYLFSLGVNIYQRLFYVAIFVSCFILIEMFLRKTKLRALSASSIVLLIIVGIFSAFFNFFQMLALDVSPNIGYVNAINASSISALTIFSTIFFKDEFTFKKFVGVLGVTVGLIALVV
ncbi:MAG: hypothetical protein UR89_C0021G0008 [Candidatus Roizmanbacteria bacterium GW2011_GWA2_35_8]|uniref:EamA domain-containing protein n=1 Tax=Candidatus Roizmanbacteria bacterium GW2011_GWA2_35_8 TaxID=1618479 RepID=A0A0G0DCT2_9BACT|nr:MAG: hypothetical protein UR89_C0021G0008 [Candidatus Roizmanbacteria bacterium GW2011_GWA2_35_8]